MRDDVKLVFPNPKTSGNGRYTYLAARGAANQADGNDPAKTRAFMTRFLKNVLVFDTGGRGATTTFVERGGRRADQLRIRSEQHSQAIR